MNNNKQSFKELGLTENILKAVTDKGYLTPTKVQIEAIPQILKKSDIIAVSQTGTGKTASFTLPILNRISTDPILRKGGIRTVILVPTRELAIQVGESVKSYSRYSRVKVVTVLGGVNINPQMIELKGGADILIATPGRLLDLFDKNAINFKCLETLVLDEADKLLDMGFTDELNRIVEILPSKRQNLLFSATFTEEVRVLSLKYMSSPVDIRIEEAITTGENIDEWLYPVDKGSKNRLLLTLFHGEKWQKVLVFVKSQNRADRLLRFLENKDIIADCIHGGKTQFARTETLERFKNGQTEILVATDLASRGIDIKSLPVVINYDLPHVPENYVHRIGRTGRAGNSGLAISFACADEFEDLVKIEKQIQTHIERKIIEGFEPKEILKPSPKIKALKPKKPKKKK